MLVVFSFCLPASRHSDDKPTSSPRFLPAVR